MTRSDLRALRSSARMLREWAKALRDAHSVDGDWRVTEPCDEAARREHDRMVRRAGDLERIAKAVAKTLPRVSKSRVSPYPRVGSDG